MKTREEQIAEMAKDLEQAKDLAMGTVGSLNSGFGSWYGAYMYNQGYRKQSDTAREIIEMLKEKESPKLLMWEYGEGYLDCIKTAEEIAAQYGVEVKE